MPFPIFSEIAGYRGVEGGALAALIICFIVFWAMITCLYCKDNEDHKEDKFLKWMIPQLSLTRDQEDRIELGGFRMNNASQCCTYSYFILMVILAGLWFVVMTLEHLIYRKTGNCNDINVSNNDFTCFNLKNDSEKIDCTSEEALNSEVDVFCYLYEFRFSAVAIGFSTYQFILFLTVLYFKLAVQCLLHCGGRCRKICICLNIAYDILVIMAINIFSIVLHYTGVLRAYFFEGLAVLRVAIFILLVVTTAIGILTPWYNFVTAQAPGATEPTANDEERTTLHTENT